MDLEGIFKQCLASMKYNVASATYKTLMEDLYPLMLKDNILIIVTNNETALNVLEIKYKDAFKKSLDELLNKDLEIKFIIENQAEKYKKNFDMVFKEDTQEEEEVDSTTGLNKKYNFDNFVVGKNNQFAYSGSLSVAELPGRTYNPLFIYGSPGLGKTHIMHAIGNFIKSDNPNANVLYVTSEAFTNEFIKSLQPNKEETFSIKENFRNKYRNCDLLLIDDIQFLSNKSETQEEFFHTFNELTNKNKQVVISSDRPPREIRDLEERLLGRFNMGLLADISKPDFETRVAILQNKVQEENLSVSTDVLYCIAEVIKTNIRELEGSLKRVMAYAKLKNIDEINLQITKEAFKGIYDENKPFVITPDRIKEVVCSHLNITSEELLSTKKSKNIVFPRQIVMYLMRNITNLSYPQIAHEQFNGMNHTTVIHNVDKIEKEIKTNPSTKNLINDLINLLNR